MFYVGFSSPFLCECEFREFNRFSQIKGQSSALWLSKLTVADQETKLTGGWKLLARSGNEQSKGYVLQKFFFETLKIYEAISCHCKPYVNIRHFWKQQKVHFIFVYTFYPRGATLEPPVIITYVCALEANVEGKSEPDYEEYVDRHGLQRKIMDF